MKTASKTPEELIVGETIILGQRLHKVSDVKWDSVNQRYNVYYYSKHYSYVIACKKTDQLTVKAK